MMRAVFYQWMVEAMVALVLHFLSSLNRSKKFLLVLLTNSKNTCRYPKGTCVEYLICINRHKSLVKSVGVSKGSHTQNMLVTSIFVPCLARVT